MAIIVTPKTKLVDEHGYDVFLMKHDENKPFIGKNGDELYYLFNVRVEKNEWQRYVDTHAFPITDRNNDQYWFNTKGKPHRLDGPAVIYSYGREIYCLNGIKVAEDDFIKETNKKISFSRNVVKSLEVLLDEPQVFGKCYYQNKKLVLSIRKKVEDVRIFGDD